MQIYLLSNRSSQCKKYEILLCYVTCPQQFTGFSARGNSQWKSMSNAFLLPSKITINPFTFFDGLYSWPRFIITFSTRDNPHFFDLCSDEISPRATRGQGSVCPCVSLQIMNYDLPWSRLKTMEDAARDEANQSPGSGVTNVNKSDSWINIIGPRGRGEEVE